MTQSPNLLISIGVLLGLVDGGGSGGSCLGARYSDVLDFFGVGGFLCSASGMKSCFAMEQLQLVYPRAGSQLEAEVSLVALAHQLVLIASSALAVPWITLVTAFFGRA